MSQQHIFLPVADPFRGVRQEFERRMGVRGVDHSGFHVTETESEVCVSLDLPGVSEDAVDISVEKGILTIQAERKATVPPNAKVLFSNTPQGTTEKTLRLDDSIDPDSIDAVMDNGVLSITMSRKPELQPRKVTVRPAAS